MKNYSLRVLVTFAILLTVYFPSFSQLVYYSPQISEYISCDIGAPNMNNINYNGYISGGCSTVENAPIPWGEYYGSIENMYFIGGDCWNCNIDVTFNMPTNDLIAIYEYNYSNELILTACIYGEGNYENASYELQYPLISREARVYFRVLKCSNDTPDDYFSGYYMFRGLTWYCNHTN